MKRHPIAITEDVDLFAIGSLLVNHGYRHLPVVDEDNQLSGDCQSTGCAQTDESVLLRCNPGTRRGIFPTGPQENHQPSFHRGTPRLTGRRAICSIRNRENKA